MKIQLDIPKEINKELKKYKIDYELQNLQEVIIRILERHFNIHIRKVKGGGK